MKAEGVLNELLAENESLYKKLRVKEKQLRVCLEALEFECGKRCAHENPCNAKNTLSKVRAMEIIG